ncbi:MAG TPA: DUF4142 domain-containing protein [Terriglobales bacterium]|nr:DUF4142 domain-containing protein [Terriglobales bacterium]
MHSLRNATLLLAGSWLAVALAAAQTGYPQQQPSQQAATQPAKSAASANQRAADFLNTLNQSEIAAAHMMQDHSRSDQVKDYTKMIATDHQDAQNQLESVASQSNLALHTDPKMMESSDKRKTRLQNESSTQADKSYIAAEVKEHREAIRELNRLEPQVTDPHLKSYIQSTVPVLQKHLNEAQKLHAELGGGKKM